MAEHVRQPAVFVRELLILLELYADRTHRPGQSGTPHSLLDSFNTPAPVLKRLLLELRTTVGDDSQVVLPLCDALWQQPNLECRTLAASLLGQHQLPEEAIIQRLQDWLSSSSEVAARNMEDRILDSLLDNGLAPVRRDNPNAVLALAKSLLEQKQILAQQAGLRALKYLAADPTFDNLPGIYRLIAPLLRILPMEMRPEVVDVLTELIQRAPAEVAFVLKQSLIASENPDTPWLVRRVMDCFPEEIRPGLRSALAQK